ncbi:hypothetical protein [Yoonia sp. SS1-5]|uniref:Uncharacterized protein n=1 Tax=Yoonia rhodophyticola TaxID=3137370 RepID=A0AAN0M942_9RHOB
MRIAAIVLGLALCATAAWATPPYRNSVASNDIAFITADDPNGLNCVVSLGRATREMPDPRIDDLFAKARIHEARFADGVNTEIWVHDDIGAAAPAYAQKVGRAMGHLPTAMRRKLDHVVVLAGDGSAFAEDVGQFFVLFAENIDTRLANDDLEETVFHETVHATLDIPHAGSAAWRAAQAADRDAITAYAANNLGKEDLAETALFAYALVETPGRLSSRVVTQLETRVPRRIAYLRALFADMSPRFQQVAPALPCN